ncbi:Elmo ced-12 family protein, partial [Globisporangium splendens]
MAQRYEEAADGAVLCRYFFQHMLAEDATVREECVSSILLSSEPTLGELRRKFPFDGQYHFRLQHVLNGGKAASYCWLDLSEPHHVLPVTKSHSGGREIRVKVLQLSHEPQDDAADAVKQEPRDLVDVPEDRQFAAYFHAHHQYHNESQSSHESMQHQQSPQQQQMQDVSSVLSGVKKALASKMKTSAMAQTIQKKSAKMWEKVIAGTAGGSVSMPPTAPALAQLAKLVGALKAPLYESNRDHVDLLNRLWVTCYDAQPLTLRGAGWEVFGFRYDDPLRELQFVLPLQCLVFFHEVHRNVALPILKDQSTPGPASYPYALVGTQVSFLVADLLQLKDGGCLGSERPFWRLFEDPIAFFELFSIAFRAFDQSWKMNSSKSTEIGAHLEYVAEFSQELLRRSPESVAALVEIAHQMQNW